MITETTPVGFRQLVLPENTTGSGTPLQTLDLRAFNLSPTLGAHSLEFLVPARAISPSAIDQLLDLLSSNLSELVQNTKSRYEQLLESLELAAAGNSANLTERLGQLWQNSLTQLNSNLVAGAISENNTGKFTNRLIDSIAGALSERTGDSFKTLYSTFTVDHLRFGDSAKLQSIQGDTYSNLPVSMQQFFSDSSAPVPSQPQQAAPSREMPVTRRLVPYEKRKPSLPKQKSKSPDSGQSFLSGLLSKVRQFLQQLKA